MQQISIGNQGVGIKEYNGKRVVTFKDIDRVHDHAQGNARKRFADNRKHFAEGRDYFTITRDDPMSEKRTLQIPPKGITLITESGYLMLAKSFTDDKAWQVQRTLVETYFRRNAAPTEQLKLEEPYEYKPKFWRGRQVVTIVDIEKATGIPRGSIQNLLVRHGKELRKDEAEVLRGEAMTAFRRENPDAVAVNVPYLWVITERWFRRLAQWRKSETPKLTVWGARAGAEQTKMQFKPVPVYAPDNLPPHIKAMGTPLKFAPDGTRIPTDLSAYQTPAPKGDQMITAAHALDMAIDMAVDLYTSGMIVGIAANRKAFKDLILNVSAYAIKIASAT